MSKAQLRAPSLGFLEVVGFFVPGSCRPMGPSPWARASEPSHQRGPCGTFVLPRHPLPEDEGQLFFSALHTPGISLRLLSGTVGLPSPFCIVFSGGGCVGRERLSCGV